MCEPSPEPKMVRTWPQRAYLADCYRKPDRLSFHFALNSTTNIRAKITTKNLSHIHQRGKFPAIAFIPSWAPETVRMARQWPRKVPGQLSIWILSGVFLMVAWIVCVCVLLIGRDLHFGCRTINYFEMSIDVTVYDHRTHLCILLRICKQHHFI